MVIPFTAVCTVVQSMDWMSIPWNWVLFAQYSQVACLQVWSSNWCFTSVLIFSFSSHNSQGSPREAVYCGVWACLYLLPVVFSTLSMASFHHALLHTTRAAWSWCPLICLLAHFIFVLRVPALIACMISNCLSNGLLAHGFILFVRTASPLHIISIDPCVCQ